MGQFDIGLDDTGLDEKFEILASLFCVFNFPNKPLQSSKYFRAVSTLYGLNAVELDRIADDTWGEWYNQLDGGEQLKEDEYYLHEFTRRLENAIEVLCDDMQDAFFIETTPFSFSRQFPEGINFGLCCAYCDFRWTQSESPVVCYDIIRISTKFIGNW